MIEVIEKAFAVLECLADADSPISLAMVSEKLNIPKPTLYRILQSLVELGYVAKEKRDGSYLRTSKLEKLGANSYYQNLKARAVPVMEWLHDKFNETVNLGALIDTQVHYIHFLNTTKPLRHMVEPEATDSFYSTALGRAIVAFLPENEKEALVNKVKLQAYTPHTVRTKTQLREIICQTKQQRFAIDNEENDLGVVCFGVPLLENGCPIGAISISLPKSRCTKEIQTQIIKELKAITW